MLLASRDGIINHAVSPPPISRQKHVRVIVRAYNLILNPRILLNITIVIILPNNIRATKYRHASRPPSTRDRVRPNSRTIGRRLSI